MFSRSSTTDCYRCYAVDRHQRQEDKTVKKVSYAITRHGSNSANQSMCGAAEIDIISAHSTEAAVAFAYKKVNEGRYTLFSPKGRLL